MTTPSPSPLSYLFQREFRVSKPTQVPNYSLLHGSQAILSCLFHKAWPLPFTSSNTRSLTLKPPSSTCSYSRLGPSLFVCAYTLAVVWSCSCPSNGSSGECRPPSVQVHEALADLHLISWKVLASTILCSDAWFRCLLFFYNSLISQSILGCICLGVLVEILILPLGRLVISLI